MLGGPSDKGKSSASTSISPPSPLPPLHPNANRPSANVSQPPPPTRNSLLRSYSWYDLHSATTEAHGIYGLAIKGKRQGYKKRK
ncbi:hypothetical protein SESBI_26022 [Sesbania bispinosa]|nr:hypothetical protein SESBI_26022 [Sesbania bispinosa]